MGAHSAVVPVDRGSAVAGATIFRRQSLARATPSCSYRANIFKLQQNVVPVLNSSLHPHHTPNFGPGQKSYAPSPTPAPIAANRIPASAAPVNKAPRINRVPDKST